MKVALERTDGRKGSFPLMSPASEDAGISLNGEVVTWCLVRPSRMPIRAHASATFYKLIFSYSTPASIHRPLCSRVRTHVGEVLGNVGIRKLTT